MMRPRTTELLFSGFKMLSVTLHTCFFATECSTTPFESQNLLPAIHKCLIYVVKIEFTEVKTMQMTPYSETQGCHFMIHDW